MTVKVADPRHELDQLIEAAAVFDLLISNEDAASLQVCAPCGEQAEIGGGTRSKDQPVTWLSQKAHANPIVVASATHAASKEEWVSLMSKHSVNFETVSDLSGSTIMVAGPGELATQRLCSLIEDRGGLALGPVTEVSLGRAIVANIVVDGILLHSGWGGVAPFSEILEDRRLLYAIQPSVTGFADMEHSSREKMILGRFMIAMRTGSARSGALHSHLTNLVRGASSAYGEFFGDVY